MNPPQIMRIPKITPGTISPVVSAMRMPALIEAVGMHISAKSGKKLCIANSPPAMAKISRIIQDMMKSSFSCSHDGLHYTVTMGRSQVKFNILPRIQ